MHVLKRRANALGLIGALAVLVTSLVWGRQLQQRERRIKLGAAPFVGEWDARWSWRILPAIGFGVLVVMVLPSIVAKTHLMVAASLGGVGLSVFSFLLAASDGLPAVLAPVVHPTEYWANLATLPSAGSMLQRFSHYDFLVDRSVHLKGHPPGFILVLKGLADLGLGRPWVTGALSFLGAFAVVPAVTVTVRTLVSEQMARRVVPYLGVAPFVIWIGTSADAFFTGVCAWGVACVALALVARTTPRRIGFAVAAGVLLGYGLFLSYGVVALLPLPAVIVATGIRQNLRRGLQVTVCSALGALIVAAVFIAHGFWWFDGLKLTKEFYWNGSAYFRTWTYFMVSNVAVLMIAVGPAVVSGVWRLRDRSLWLVVGGALLGVMVAEVSQYSKGEVERIWLLFMPWLVPATAALGPTMRGHRVWLSVQVLVAVVLQALLRSKW